MSIHRTLFLWAAASTCLLLTSCVPYRPKRYIPPNIFRSQYLNDVTRPNLLKEYDDLADAKAKVDYRNKVLTELIALIDQNYSDFENQYYGLDAKVNFGGDFVNLGLTGVSSVTGTAHLKSVLSAIATGTTGMKTSYQKNFFDQQTRAAIVQQMRASRAKQLAIIQDQDHMKSPAACQSNGCPLVLKVGVTEEHAGSPYSLEAGLVDIDRYYEAGTIIGALQSIAESAGADQKKAADKQAATSMATQLF